MKKLFIFALLTLNTSALAYNQGDDVLTGDTKLACEAVLCLSSSARPGECSPSLDRYFGIKHKHFSDTINARINFLNLCPASNQPNMPSLISAIGHGAGRCDAEYLNQYNKETFYRKTCTKDYAFGEPTCITEAISVVSDEKPYYCTAYEHHEFTDLNTKYLGEKFKGGRWYDAKDYDKALADYNRQLEQNAVATNRSRIGNSSNATVTYTSEYDVKREERQSR